MNKVLTRKLAATAAPLLSPDEVKKLYDQAVRKSVDSTSRPSQVDSPPSSSPNEGSFDSALEEALNKLKTPSEKDRFILIETMKRAYIAIKNKDWSTFATYFGKLEALVRQFKPDSLTDDFFLFLSDPEMWKWLSMFKKRIKHPSEEDKIYIYYLGQDLYSFIHEEIIK